MNEERLEHASTGSAKANVCPWHFLLARACNSELSLPLSWHAQAECAGVLNFYACKGAHTLFNAQRERGGGEGGRVRESERKREM
jgi:hypothetical protein